MSAIFNASRDSKTDIEYQTISSTVSFLPEDQTERLHNLISKDQLDKLHQAFSERPDSQVGFGDLRSLLLDHDITFNDAVYKRLFLKINQNRDFRVDWNEFVSYLIFGFQEEDPSSQKESLILPISVAPSVRKTEHRSTVCCVALLKAKSDQVPIEEVTETVNFSFGGEDSPEASGMWVTASHEGMLRFWTSHMEPIRTATSESIHLKMPTWILAVQALSDVSIVCTSSTERELRFHETIASTFTLRMVIRSMPHAVYCMSYAFYNNGKVHSKLVLGDYAGNVRIISYSPHLRGPFQAKPGAALIEVVWTDVLKGKIPQMIPKEYINLHNEMITCVHYSLHMNALFATAEYRNTKKYRGRCPGMIMVTYDERSNFRVPLGVSTFFVAESHNIVVTGGPDTFVRIWDVYIPTEPSAILTGHNGGIVTVFVQPEENKVYSVDYQKIIKVWDLQEHTLLQTYGELVRLIHPSETDLTYFYHSHLRELIVAGRKLISIKCCPRVRVDLTDGNTHAAPVSVVLYNHLFRNIVTCGLDSYIIVWDPWTGRRKIIMKNCHTKMIYGEIIDIEITAATFDPLEQFLLTGARDGSLKIWNYNNSVVVRNMSIMPDQEVTSVIWVVDRILAMGWDRQVTEFNDVEGREYGDPKKWSKFHTDDITCADVKLGEGVVTATYSGEVIFWKLETGQPYRRYSVMDPKRFIELKLTAEEEKLMRRSKRLMSRTSHGTSRNSRVTSFTTPALPKPEDTRDYGQNVPISVQAVLFLQSRPQTLHHGSVFISLDTGYIQMYSHHQRGGYMDQFMSVHKTGDCVLTMCTDRKNRYLYTGTAFGYIKIWHIVNYCVPEAEKVHVCMPKLRLEFIFLRKEFWVTRAKRVVRHQREPLLVSSYKAHLKAINSISFINLPKIVFSGSHDYSCRLWTQGGRYLGTLGTVLPWSKLTPFERAGDVNQVYRLPPDIKKVASSTTLKVISGLQMDRPVKRTEAKAPEEREEQTAQTEDGYDLKKIFEKPLKEPILGKHFTLPGKSVMDQRIDVDTTQSYIAVYTHLKVHNTEMLERLPTPAVISRVAAENYLEHYVPVEGKVNLSGSALNIKQPPRRPASLRPKDPRNMRMAKTRGDMGPGPSPSQQSQ
ncbi:WD repeat-containing protein on Y chromosome [Drosophila guanche]|uniref:WD repeat-containing protein on Y chromosome n=1 Tax=Drosophila guanche TaxID=7266 RepID=A0A3B0JM86_DROGU|nr:WD repeat-containing protein on Y chromosome [Drosophila guanche]SPP81442.1 blast:WD repeat-containing protein on Y chromosome [Drosophila guanche]